MDFKIVTWNINSIRLRENLICNYLKEEKPDVLICRADRKETFYVLPEQQWIQFLKWSKIIKGDE